jgi:type II secretory pathway pseudopilin PulG
MDKKGSLNLSIQMIVIVVIAFVVLGLGLGFVRSQFGDIQKTTTAVQEQISQQILEELRTGNKPLSFPASKLVLETSEESVQAIGVKNTKDQELNFKVEFSVKTNDGFKPLTEAGEVPFTAVSGEEFTSTVLWDTEEQSLKPGKTNVIPITITAPNKIGNYLYKVALIDLGEGNEEFASKTFFIKTS